MKNIEEGIKEIHDSLRILESEINGKKDLIRIHKDNVFNRRFSVVLSDFSDFETIGMRLSKNISRVEVLQRSIQKGFEGEDKVIITDEGQRLRQEDNHINSENQVDFKCLYIFSKIFLDQYTVLIRFLFDWRKIGDKSITNFYNSLVKYKGDNKQIISFRDSCLSRLKAVNVFVTEYRDQYVVHDQTKHKDTRWFLNDMKGSIRFIGGRPSITPQELVFVVSNYITESIKFLKAQKDNMK